MASLPESNQAVRVFWGMLPKYYYKVDFSYPTPETEVLTYWQYDWRIEDVNIAAIIQVTYTDSTKNNPLTVERTYYNETK